MGSEKGKKDRGKREDIVRGRARFVGGEVDVALVDCDQDVLILTTGFNRQLTGEVGRRRIPARNSTDEGRTVEGSGVKGVSEGRGR